MSIRLDLAPEQAQIVDAMRRAFAPWFPAGRLRGRHEGNEDHRRWSELAGLGVFGLSAPESDGGAGFTLAEDALLFVECGRALLTPCVLATVIAARIAREQGLHDLAADFIAGRQRACVATVAEGDVSGQATLLLHDATGCGHAVTWDARGAVLLRIDGVPASAVHSLDGGVAIARADVHGDAVLARTDSTIASHADLLVAALLLGMAQACRDMAVAHAGTRVQFGQPIGAFQAVKHRCADMAIGVHALHAQLVFAAIAARDAWPDASQQVDACRLLAVRTAMDNARANIQVHGAIGFTAECDAHLYLLRTHVLRHFGGRMAHTMQRLATPEAPCASR